MALSGPARVRFSAKEPPMLGVAIEEGFIKKPRQTVVLTFWGKMATHMLLLRRCSRQIVKKWAGSKLWGVFVYYIFYNRWLVFIDMFCGILANKIIKSVFNLEIQIYIKHPLSTPPTKANGKVQQLCTPYCTFRPNIPSAAYDLAPQTETTTVCLVFCINPSSMASKKYFNAKCEFEKCCTLRFIKITNSLPL